MLDGFSNASRIPELRRRLLFTAAMLAVFRMGVAVPTPGIDGQALASLFEQTSGTLFGWVNLFSGGALEHFSVLALGIMPYISVAIVLDLLKIASPYLDELYKEGGGGPPQDYPVHPLRHRDARAVSGHDVRHRARESARTRRRQHCLQSRPELHHHDGD